MEELFQHYLAIDLRLMLDFLQVVLLVLVLVNLESIDGKGNYGGIANALAVFAAMIGAMLWGAWRIWVMVFSN